MRLHSPPKWAPLSNNETTYRLTATLSTGLGARRTDSLKAGLGGDPLKVQDEGGDCPVPEHSDPDTEVPRWATNPFSLPPISAPPPPQNMRAPTHAASTMETAPSSACPRRSQPAPACAQLATASGVASRLVRVSTLALAQVPNPSPSYPAAPPFSPHRDNRTAFVMYH